MSRDDKKEKRAPTVYILIFILLAAGISLVGYLSYRNFEQQFRLQTERQLSSVADLKVNELQAWRSERLADGHILSNNQAFSALVQSYFENPQDTQLQAEIQAWLNSYHTYGEYDRVRLLDMQGNTHLSVPEGLPPISNGIIQRIPDVSKSGQVTLVDFYRDNEDQRIYMTVLIPILKAGNADQTIGFVTFRIDPSKYLYPFLQQWPSPSTSAETLLVRREGQDVLFLNPLRFQPDAALKLNIPLEQTKILAAKAVLGFEGISQGIDYRGQEVIGDLRKVPNSPWFLVARMDTAEVYAPLRARLWQTIIIFSVLVLAAGIGLMFFWRQQRLNYYRMQYETAESLRKSEEQYRGLVEHASDGIFIADASGKYLEVNPSGYAMLGYSRDEILSKYISDLVAPEDMVSTPLRLEELRQGKTVLTERRLIRKDGSLLPVEISARMFPDGRFQSIIRDITERKQAENALQESEASLRALLNAVHESIFLMKADGTTVAVNETTAIRLRTHAADMIGHNIFNFLPPDLADSRRAYVEEVIASGKPARFEDERFGKWVDNSIYPVIDETGRVTYLAVYGNDITERKQAEESVKRSERKYRQLHESMMDGFVCVEMDGTFLECNEVYRNMLGYSEAELEKITYVDLTPEKWHAFESDIVENQIIKRGYSDIYEKEYRRKDGTIFPVELHTVLTRDENGNPVNMWGIARDITERKRAEESIRYQANLLANVNDAITSSDEHAILKSWNHAAEIMFGWKAEEVIGKLGQDVFLTEFIGMDRKEVFRIVGETGEFRGEMIQYRKDGTQIFVEANTYTVRDEDGNISGYVTASRDITERKQAEEKLIASETRYRRLFEAARDGILILDAETGVIVDVNPFLIEMLGFTYEEICGKELWELGFFKDIVANKANFLELQQKEFIRYDDLPLEISNGRKLYVEFVSNIYEVNHQKVVQCNIRDITERKQAEDAQKQSETLFRMLFELSPDAVVLLDPHDPNVSSPIVDCNTAACLMNGYDRDELIGQPIDIVNADPYTHAGQTAYLKKLRDAGNLKYEVFHRRKNGVVFPVEVSTAIIKVGERELVIGIDRDITERKRAENALRESETKYRSLIQSIQIGLVVHAPDSSIQFSNPRASELLGLTSDQMRGKTAIDEAWHFIREDETRMPLEEYPINQALAADAPISNLILGVIRPDQEKPIWVQCNAHQDRDLNGNLQQVVVTFADITERKEAEQVMQEYNTRLETEVDQRTRELREAQQQLVRQERLATLGQLAGSIGHELRNPLGVISNAVYYLKMMQPDASENVREYLDIIDNETHTSNKIITDLLDFTRIKSIDRTPVSVSELIRRTLERFPAPATVDVALEIPADLPQMYVDPQHIVQVLGNLVTNAYQAMDNGVPNERELKVSATAGSAMIKIDIQDMGVGIPPENMKKLFEPLFTTKIKGIGLGLAVSRKLTEANGGRIEVQSEAGKGSTFTVYLPVYKEPK